MTETGPIIAAHPRERDGNEGAGILRDSGPFVYAEVSTTSQFVTIA